jgi:gamma-glutamyl-gamma-aminobutyrate hydrolase PuuD
MSGTTSGTTSYPRVGISTHLVTAQWGVWSRPAALLPASYVEAVAGAGGVPVLLPPAGPMAGPAIGGVDALVLAGGPDIDPARYGAAPHAKTARVQPERDQWELDLLAAALEQGVPVLGICRGIELMNVAFGGDLIQHLPEHGTSIDHRSMPGRYVWHRVRLAGEGLVATALGAEAVVASYHHQGIGRVGTGLRPVGWSDDGLIEALELSGPDFAIGVLWHPEEHEQSAGPGVFAALVDAARRSRRLANQKIGS